MDEHSQHRHGSGQRAGTWVFIGFLLVAGYFLLTEHRAHFIGYLPFLLVLACPLLHLFHGHGGHRHGSHRDEATTGASPQTKPGKAASDAGPDR